MKRTALLPGAISAFRLFILIRLSIALVSWLVQTLAPISHQVLPYATIATLLETSFLLVYLSMPWMPWKPVQRLHQRLGHAYLLIGLAIATLGPLLESFLFIIEVSRFLPTLDPTSLLAEAFIRQAVIGGLLQELIALLVPLILVAWEYRLRYMVIYLLTLPALELGLFLLSGIGTPILWQLIGTVGMRTLLFLLIGYVINRLAFDLRDQNRQLSDANRGLIRYAATLEELATSRERNRLAREFHDTVAHTLSALAVQLEAVTSLWESDSARARTLLDQSLGMTRAGLNETRRSIQALRASPLEDLGLAAALGALARTTADRAGLALELDFPACLDPLPAEIEQSVYRIAEESLRNAAQHAQATRLRLCVTQSVPSGPGAPAVLSLTIQDDGRGFEFDSSALEDRFGLRGMQERAADAGGTLEVDSHPGQGTTVRLTLEVKA